ncbi:hypothetical protein M3Y99_00114900 [Aphelenchoides fujianensis]|nr:hypothetical protein M3Y99_00114900 [Aphelenchoides fujianensis]
MYAKIYGLFVRLVRSAAHSLRRLLHRCSPRWAAKLSGRMVHVHDSNMTADEQAEVLRVVVAEFHATADFSAVPSAIKRHFEREHGGQWECAIGRRLHPTEESELHGTYRKKHSMSDLCIAGFWEWTVLLFQRI